MDQLGGPLGVTPLELERGKTCCWPKGRYGRTVPWAGRPLQQYLSLEGQREPLQVWVGKEDVKSSDSTCHRWGLKRCSLTPPPITIHQTGQRPSGLYGPLY